jgi:low temperature requirement protein LtrA
MMIFTAIWWAWNQYTWFASSFDNNSVKFRIFTLVQMIGALIIAAGVKLAFEGNFSIIILGYVVIRIPAVLMWFNVARDNPHLKVTAIRYAVGILLAQVAWVTQSFFTFSYIVFILLWLLEFAVPYYAESHTVSSFHAEHIEERFGLLLIIVLGESILASTQGFITLTEHFSYDILGVTLGAIVTLFGLWWLYFNNSVEHLLEEKNIAFMWGYVHSITFASAAAIGALVSVNIDVLTAHASITLMTANVGFAIAVAIYLASIWLTQERILSNSYLLLLVAGLTMLLGFLPHSIVSISILIIATVTYRQYYPIKNVH